MGILTPRVATGKRAHIEEPSSVARAVESKLFLAICLLDRSKSETSENPEIPVFFDQCRAMLNAIRRTWSACEEDGFGAAVDVAYKINLLMAMIERLMGKLPMETASYTRLQQCINLLDEVDLILETVAVLQTTSV